MPVGTWKKRQIDKRNKGKQETGKSKGIVADPLVKTMCRRNRSWKHPRYSDIMGIKPSLDQSGHNGEFPRKGGKKG